MRGLSIVGATLDAAETRVAAAACLAYGAAGLRSAAFVPVALGPSGIEALEDLAEATAQGRDALAGHRLPVAASPLVAARHTGIDLDPSGLLERAAGAAAGREVLVIALAGGLLAPLTPRYAVRDLARDAGAPVVVAARAGADMTAVVRMSVEVARAGGLRLAAVVLTGWPAGADRVLVDERRALAELLDVALLHLPADAIGTADLAEAAREWPVGRWLDAGVGADEPGRGGAAAGQGRPEVVLESYREWEPRPLGDPRTTQRPAVMAALLEIVGVEGPMTATRAYTLCNRAGGGRKLTAVARAPLVSAAQWLARERRIVLTPEDDIPWQGDDVLRGLDTPAVQVRELGPRVLEEVPLDEVAELVRRLRAARGLRDPDDLKRGVLSAYGLVRLTARADQYLTLAVELAAE